MALCLACLNKRDSRRDCLAVSLAFLLRGFRPKRRVLGGERGESTSVSLVEVVLLGLALSMDAFAVTVSNVFAHRGLSRGRAMLMPVFFGAFQGLMPLLGFFAGSLVAEVIERYAGIVAFVILGFVGGKMIWDAFHEEDGDVDDKTLTVGSLFVQAIATSIDAFAVGVSFVGMGVEPLSASGIIALTTFVCTCLALLVGRTFGSKLGEKATVVGGVVLILIGIKALI